jgi:hypothetical protein
MHQPFANLSIHIDYIPIPAKVVADHTDWYARTTFPALTKFFKDYPKKDYLDQILNDTSIARPDDDLLCLDNTFYIADSTVDVDGKITVKTEYELEEMGPEDPVWLEIGQHFHYNEVTERMAQEIMMRSGIIEV